MSYTNAQKRATNKWIKNNYDRVNLTLKSGQKKVWKEAAQNKGMSLNDFIRSAVNDKIGSMTS